MKTLVAIIMLLSSYVEIPLYIKKQEICNILKIMETKDLDKAIYTYLASLEYKIDYKLLTHLINSESSYIYTKHSLDFVSGLAGINTKVWKLPNKTDKEQIYAGAFVLKTYLDMYKGDELEALHAYKSRTPMGLRQAKKVYFKYKQGI